MLDTILLDVDGTLIDSAYHHSVAWSRAFADHGLRPPMAHIHRAIGMGGDKLVAEVTTEGVERAVGDHVRESWERHYRELVREVRPVDGAAELVRDIRQQGLRVALASSGKEEFTEAAMQSLGLGRHELDAVTSSDSAEDSKPDPDVLQVALEEAGGTTAIVVGDSPYDTEAATRLGALSVGVRSGGYSEAELRAAGCVLVVDTAAELTGLDWRSLALEPVR